MPITATRGASRSRVLKGKKIRVLIVDDSVVIRNLVSKALAAEPDIEVAGVAADGAIALQKIEQVNPDVITLDIEMPNLDGLETLSRLREKYKDLCVIMFSTLTERGGQHTLEALSRGADDYVTKAANVGSLDESMARLREELVPKIRQFFDLESVPGPGAGAASAPAKAPTAARVTRPRTPSLRIGRPDILAIGVSTGGPNALAEIFPAFPKHYPLPIVMVQHMPPLFTRLLAERLDNAGPLSVVEASEPTDVEPGKCIIAPGGKHMVLKRDGNRVVTALNEEPPENSCRPAVDVLFRSVHKLYGGKVLAVILTGMGRDGYLGVELLRSDGAYVIAQDRASSVVWGMPGFVAEGGLADEVLDLHDIVPAIVKHS